MSFLYGDLPKAKSDPEAKPPSGWASSNQPSKAGGPGGFLAPTSLLRHPTGMGAGRGGASGLGGGRGAGRGGAAGGAGGLPGPGPSAPPAAADSDAAPRGPGAGSAAEGEAWPWLAREEGGAATSSALETSSAEEYDPMTPNDYMEIVRSREAALKATIEEADRQIKIREVERKIADMDRRRREAEGGGGTGAAAALLAASEEGRPSVLKGHSGGLAAAARMMEKMGWRAGVGLGRKNQGMVAPLIAQRLDGRTAVVTEGDMEDHIGLGGLGGAGVARGGGGRAEEKGGQEQAQGPSAADLRREKEIREEASCCLLLTNMVAPGSVDNDLQDETAEECARYGPVSRVVIFEVTQAGYSPEEAVRIIVEFKEKSASIAAYRDLDGRFFAGRQVRARFFSQERMERGDWGPGEGEAPARP